MNAVDLFAGAGGFSTGARMAGCNAVVPIVAADIINEIRRAA